MWATNTIGDGSSTYNQTETMGWLKRTFGDGIIRGYANELAVSVGTLSVDIATGAAVVNGSPYENGAIVNLAVPHPSATTAHRVVLRWSDTANTVRIALVSATDGVSTPPTLTTGTPIYEILLADLTITNADVITVNDSRKFSKSNPMFVARQGGDATDWGTPGTTNQSIETVVQQAGVFIWSGAAATSGFSTITFPKAFAARPLLFVTSGTNFLVHVEAEADDETEGTVLWRSIDATTHTDVTILWHAIGPST